MNMLPGVPDSVNWVWIFAWYCYTMRVVLMLQIPPMVLLMYMFEGDQCQHCQSLDACLCLHLTLETYFPGHHSAPRQIDDVKRAFDIFDACWRSGFPHGVNLHDSSPTNIQTKLQNVMLECMDREAIELPVGVAGACPWALLSVQRRSAIAQQAVNATLTSGACLDIKTKATFNALVW
jgi:hypothetical protein